MNDADTDVGWLWLQEGVRASLGSDPSECEGQVGNEHHTCVLHNRPWQLGRKDAKVLRRDPQEFEGCAAQSQFVTAERPDEEDFALVYQHLAPARAAPLKAHWDLRRHPM